MDEGLKSQIAALPDTPGIYLFYDARGQLLYVGKSVSIKKRAASYFTKTSLGPKTDRMIAKIAKIGYIKVFAEIEALLLEAALIKKQQPFFNTVAKDDKSPLYIKIDNSPIPQVTAVRRQKPQKGISLVGPFPSAKTTREVLKVIRKIFPYCHHKNPKKPCLFVHLGLCPYPYQSKEVQANYLNTIVKIKKFLSGKNKALIGQLTFEMTKFSQKQQYEEANLLKKQIAQLQYITTTYHPPAEFLERPTLVDDLTLARLKDLTGVLGLGQIPRRIECYDISNIAGRHATGAMVVFTNGQADKSQYRKFKIKLTHKPNDLQMLKEVLERRLKNDWPKPNLIIIDGGRGQLNIALSVNQKFKVNIPVVSLAKRFEQIYVPGKILPISLTARSAARQLIQAIRDEAHRFAITYHRLLRSKSLLESGQLKSKY